MTGYEFGDIVLVSFPFTDQSTTKRRPAVVVSSDAYQRERPDLIILAVTSQARPQRLPGEAPIVKWKEAGLLRASVLKPVVATIERGLVLRKLGKLAEETSSRCARCSERSWAADAGGNRLIGSSRRPPATLPRYREEHRPLPWVGFDTR